MITVCDVEKIRKIAIDLNLSASKQFFSFESDWIVEIFYKVILNTVFEEKEIRWLFQNYPASFLILIIDYFVSIDQEHRVKSNYNFFINTIKEWKSRWGLFRWIRRDARDERKQLIRLYGFIRRETKKHYRTI